MARRRHQRTLEYDILLTATLCLLAAGAVMVFSASSARTVLQGEGDGTGYLVKYLAYGALGLIVAMVVARRGLEIIPKITTPLLAVAALCLVLTQTPLGVEVNGAKRWLGVGPLVFQPSELMKLALLLYAAKYLAEHPKRVATPRLLVPLLLVGMACLALVLMQPDLGTALVIAATMTAMLFAAGIPGRALVTGGAIGGVFVFIYAMSAPYRRDRLMTFLDPWAHASDEGFQAVQGQIALGSGGFSGRGLGESGAKNLFLPEAHTDFILAIVGEELGVLGVCGVLFLYGLVAYAGLQAAKQAKGRYAKLLATGVTALFLCQATLNVYTVLGLAPLTGVPLPFISYGGTNLIVLLAAMGLLLNVASGGSAHLRVVEGSRAGARTQDRHRSGGNSRARGAGAGSRRRATG